MRRGDDRVDPGEKFVLEMDDGGDVSVTLSGTSHVIKFAITVVPTRRGHHPPSVSIIHITRTGPLICEVRGSI